MKKDLTIGIIFLFLFSSLAPIISSYNLDELFLIKDDVINFSVYNMPEEVMVNKSGDCWINQSKIIIIIVYGEPGNYPMNASIIITGCGLNISIDERYAIEEGYWLEDGLYNVSISPKTGGTLSIMVINMTYNLSKSKDFIIEGLTGVAKTSYGEDNLIFIGIKEKIIFIINYGQFADVHLTWVDELWNDVKCINQTVGDNTVGNGLNGIFEFTPYIDNIDYIGYIIAVAEAGGNYIWDLIEVRTFNIPPPKIFGPKKCKVWVEYDYNFLIPNVTYCDSLLLLVGWGDTEPGKWDGPYETGENVTLTHKWQKVGNYKILAMVKDVFGKMSDWGNFDVTTPRTREIYNFNWLSFLERFPILKEVFSRLI